MKLKDIQFKVTSSKKLSCGVCKDNLFGEEGFVKIRIKKVGGWGYYSNPHLINICWKCFMALVVNLKEDRKGRKKKFETLLKKQIIRKLNK